MIEYLTTQLTSLLPGSDHAYDRKVIRDRVASEGFGFTIALEALAAHLQVSLDLGRWTPISGYFLRRKNSVLPRFLGFEFASIFTDEGEVRENANIKSVRLILQVCLLFKKFSAEPSDEMKEASYDSLTKVQTKLKGRLTDGFYTSLYMSEAIGDPLVTRVKEILHELWAGVLDGVTDGSYGPGSNLLGIEAQTLSERTPCPYTFPEGPARELLSSIVRNCHDPKVHTDPQLSLALEETTRKPFSYLRPLAGLYDNHNPFKAQDSVVSTAVGVSDYCKLIAVPKTSRKARLIGKMHPDHVYVQLAIEKSFKRRIRRNTLFNAMLPFGDQRVPSERAVSSSRDGSGATLDLSAASDWLAYALAQWGLPSDVMAVLSQTRASFALIPGRPPIDMYSYGQMGDGTTFVVLSSFCAAIALAVCELEGIEINPYDPPVVVYGDDIQCPSSTATKVVASLERFGFVVNTQKSFMTPGGYFRESCNGWGAFGHPVKPVFIRKRPIKGDWESIHSALSSARQLDQYGFLDAANILYNDIEDCLGFRLPEARSDDEHFGRFARNITELPKAVPVWRLRSRSFANSEYGQLRYAIKNLSREVDIYRDKTRFIRELTGFRFKRTWKEKLSTRPQEPKYVQLELPLFSTRATMFDYFNRGDVTLRRIAFTSTRR